MAVGISGRPAGVVIHAGVRFGRLLIERKVHTKEGLRWKARCDCGNQITTKTQYLTRKPNPQISCGCHVNEGANPWKREKQIWHMMHVRTENPSHVSFKDYGGRGIKVCAAWNKAHPEGPDAGWEAFIAYIGPAPTQKHSIDRVNPNLGYQPYQEDGVTRQVRWATSKEQANNQRRHWGKK